MPDEADANEISAASPPEDWRRPLASSFWSSYVVEDLKSKNLC